jgi:hypothetical protein
MVSIHRISAPGESRGLLRERLAGRIQAQGSQRLENLPGRTHAAGNEHHASGAIGLGARDGGCRFIELRDSVFGLVQLQSMPGTAEAIGQNNIGPRLDEGAVQLRNPLGVSGVPKFGCIARLQSALEQVAAGGAVGQQPRPLRQ